MVAKGDKQAPSLSSKQGQGRRRFSAVKQLTKELSYYKARQLVALGEFANNGYYQLVEQADNLRWLRDLRKQKRAHYCPVKVFMTTVSAR